MSSPKNIKKQTEHTSASLRPPVDVFLTPANPGEDFLTGAEWVAIANIVHLTTQEVVVAALLLHGRTRKSIARRMQLSPETVRVYIDRLFEKFQVKDRLGLGLRIARVRALFRAQAAEAP